MQITPKYFFLFLFLSISFLGNAQDQGNSPYHTFGVGDILPQTTASQDAMGGTGVSFGNSFYINMLNPALISKNRTVGLNKYVAFNIGSKGAYRAQTQGNSTTTDFGLNLNNLGFVFPVYKKFATGVNISPRTTAESISFFENSVNGIPSINYLSEYRSTGGLNLVTWTNSAQVGKKINLGVELQHNFGNIVKDSIVGLKGLGEAYGYTSNINLQGSSAKFGVNFTQKISKKLNFNLGATYQLQSNLKGQKLYTYGELNREGTDDDYQYTYSDNPDTLSLGDIRSQLPQSYRLGISIESPYRFIFAVDYSRTLWTKVDQFDRNFDRIRRDSELIAVGLEWLPKSGSTMILNQTFYRVGFKSEKTPYVINGRPVNDRSVSLGFSLPMGFRSPSYIDFALSIGRRGLNTNGLLVENYTKISLNFSLLSSWFYKPKIN
ncbi:MAG: hypothetical protein ACRCVT_13670 [Leadbetterella sp.]